MHRQIQNMEFTIDSASITPRREKKSTNVPQRDVLMVASAVTLLYESALPLRSHSGSFLQEAPELHDLLQNRISHLQRVSIMRRNG